MAKDVNVKDSLSRLVELARAATSTDEQREEQRRSFAFGNTAFENQAITRAMIDSEAEKLKRS